MGDESLLTSTVPRTLDTKSKILGFELSDVLLLLLNLSIQNLIFGATHLKIPMVFGTNIALGALLFIFKRGKPDQFIQHFFEYLVSPTVKTANCPDHIYVRFERRSL